MGYIILENNLKIWKCSIIIESKLIEDYKTWKWIWFNWIIKKCFRLADQKNVGNKLTIRKWFPSGSGLKK